MNARLNVSQDRASAPSPADLELQLAMLARAATALARDSDPDRLRTHALQAAVSGTHACKGAFLVHDRRAKVFWGTAPAFGWSDADAIALSVAEGESTAIDDVFAGAVSNFTWSGGDASALPPILRLTGSRSGLIAPLWSGKDVIGVLCLCDKHEAFGEFGESDAAFVRTVLMQLGSALRSARLRDYAGGRRAGVASSFFAHGDFDAIVALEIERAERIGHALGCAVLEIADVADALRQHGPAAIDSAARQMGNLLRSNMRQTDILIRYDESTVALVMPGTNAAGARVVAERLSERLRSIDVPKTGGIKVRCGVCAYPEEAATASELVTSAVRRARN